jgi:hypothetical protein
MDLGHHSPADRLGRRAHRARGLPLGEWPVKRPSAWLKKVHAPTPQEPLAGLRQGAQRSRPPGPTAWVQATAVRLELGFKLHGPGRPAKINDYQ